MNLKTRRLVAVVLTVAVFTVGIVIFIVLKKSSELEEPPLQIEETETKSEVIGNSVQGRDIEAYTYLPRRQAGGGGNHILFVGGIHGGYEWNSVLLAYEVMDYLEVNPEIIPENVSVSVIPSLNPDGVYKIIGKEGRFNISDGAEIPREDARPGRFNANNVDLNRNFDCKWQPESTWQNQKVSAGQSPFSEPEAKALRDFVLKTEPKAVVFWHSRASAVYASECEEGILPETRQIMNLYSDASGYQKVDSFDHYEITGDAEGWLASIGIASITVELETYASLEFDKNLAGLKALLEYYR